MARNSSATDAKSEPAKVTSRNLVFQDGSFEQVLEH